jgi:hypothetical protein
MLELVPLISCAFHVRNTERGSATPEMYITLSTLAFNVFILRGDHLDAFGKTTLFQRKHPNATKPVRSLSMNCPPSESFGPDLNKEGM